MRTEPSARRLVGIFPVNARGEILLQLRDDRPDLSNPNTWSTLGGTVEAGETPEAAAVRELIEECGRTPDRLLLFVEARRTNSAGRPIAVFNYAATVDWSLDDLILGEGQGFAWFTPPDLDAIPLNPAIASDILGFAASSLRRELAASAPPPRAPAAAALPEGIAQRLGVRPGSLIGWIGGTAAVAARLRAALPAGARLTASPAPHEQLDVVLWWPEPAVEGLRLAMHPLPRTGVVWVMAQARVGPAHAALAARGWEVREALDFGDGWRAVGFGRADGAGQRENRTP